MQRIDGYLHNRPDWPNFRWDSAHLTPALVAVRHKQGQLVGRMLELGFEARDEATLRTLTSDVVRTSEIEGEILNTEEVRSSVARQLGIDIAGLPRASRQVDGVVEMTLDATRRYAEPLTKERLIGWHAALFPDGWTSSHRIRDDGLHRIRVGGWRTTESGAMRIVSGPIGKEKVHFEAPDAERVDSEMTRFLEWFNAAQPAGGPIDPVIKAGVAHLWFETIHPFEDGNGRIGRAILDMQLSRADGSSDRHYSFSSQIAAERADYYRMLESSQHGDLDITPWLSWYLGCLQRAVDGADELLSEVLHRARFWQRVNRITINERQRSVLKRMLGPFEGGLSTRKYAKLAKCSTDTALRDITELVEHGVLVRNPGAGRSTSYRLAMLDEMDGVGR